MILSAQTIRQFSLAGEGLVSPLESSYKDPRGCSAGLSACSVDVTLAEEVRLSRGEFQLASTRERFCLPDNVMARVHDKSSLIRLGLKVGNSLFDPGWRGFATLELFYHGKQELLLPVGSAIAQVVFEYLDAPTVLPYSGKYQDQQSGPQGAR